MNNPQHQMFVKRLKRVERLNRRGAGFEAVGTLGQSYYTNKARRRSFWGPAMLVAASLLLLKAVALDSVGTSAYQAKVNEMRASGPIQQVAAFVLQADPATVWLSDQVATFRK